MRYINLAALMLTTLFFAGCSTFHASLTTPDGYVAEINERHCALLTNDRGNLEILYNDILLSRQTQQDPAAQQAIINAIIQNALKTAAKGAKP